MEPQEFHKHRIRAQLIKIIAHLREARMDVNQCLEHTKIVKGADQIDAIAPLQLDMSMVPVKIEAISTIIDDTMGYLARQAERLQDAMTNKHSLTPPITGRFTQLPNMTVRQRMLIRDGDMPYSDVPTHHVVVDPNHQNKPAKPKKLPQTLVIKRKPRPKKRNDMPI